MQRTMQSEPRVFISVIALAAGVLVGAPAVSAAPDEEGSAASSDEAARELEIGDSTLSFYGFARLDAIYDDSRTNDAQTPTFVESEDPSVGPEDEDTFTLHPRLSRFGVTLEGPTLDALGGARLGGKLEVDFQNGGRESRARPRYRHAYLSLDWGNTTLLAGQTWDLISPRYPSVNQDTLMWNAGNLGDRRAQIRLTRESEGGFSAAVALGLTGAIDEKDLDSNGVRDGEDSGLPNVQARLGYAHPVGDGGTIAVGLSAHRAWEETTTQVGGTTDFDSSSVSLDFEVRPTGLVTVHGEVWSGENLSDFRGGIGQGILVSTGEEISSKGGWAELKLDPAGPYSVFTGASLDDPDDEDVPPGGRTENSTWYLGQQLDLADALRVGIDYIHWRTEYDRLDEGTDNRLNLYMIYTF